MILPEEEIIIIILFLDSESLSSWMLERQAFNVFKRHERVSNGHLSSIFESYAASDVKSFDSLWMIVPKTKSHVEVDRAIFYNLH